MNRQGIFSRVAPVHRVVNLCKHEHSLATVILFFIFLQKNLANTLNMKVVRICVEDLHKNSQEFFDEYNLVHIIYTMKFKVKLASVLKRSTCSMIFHQN